MMDDGEATHFSAWKEYHGIPRENFDHRFDAGLTWAPPIERNPNAHAELRAGIEKLRAELDAVDNAHGLGGHNG